MGGSLNNIKLDPAMLAALYRNTLVDTQSLRDPGQVKPKTKKTQPSPPKTLRFIGENRKNITVLIRNVSGSVAENEISFLQKMLKACKLEPGDVSIVPVTKNSPAMEDVIAQLNPRHILAFGTGSGRELFTMENLDGIKYLNAPALDELMKETDSSKHLKTRLWTELKAMFGI